MAAAALRARLGVPARLPLLLLQLICICCLVRSPLSVVSATTVSTGDANASSSTACPPSITNCATCALVDGLTVCTTCRSGYTISLSSDDDYAIVGRCQTYTAAAAAACQVPRCTTCAYQNNTACVVCRTGQYNADYTCPETTSATTTTTTTRPPTTTAAPATPRPPTTTAAPATTASPCTVANCVVCAGTSTDSCSECAVGYSTTLDGRCMLSGTCRVANCIQCSARSDTVCTTCAAGYGSRGNGQCRRSKDGGSAHAAAAAQGFALALLTLAVCAV